MQQQQQQQKHSRSEIIETTAPENSNQPNFCIITGIIQNTFKHFVYSSNEYGIYKKIPNGATAEQMAVLRKQHLEKNIWKEYLKTNKSLKQQLLSCLNENYIHTFLKNRTIEYANVITLQLLTYP